VKVLDALRDTDEWLCRWRATGREPFTHPSYCELFADATQRAVALVLEHRNGFALLPMIIRPLPHLPGIEESLHDAVSPYGYGGPFSSTEFALEELLPQLDDWIRENDLCSAFVRLSLEAKTDIGRLSPRAEVVEALDNVVVDLRPTPEALWKSYEHKVRKNVNKARRAGCTVDRDETLDNVDRFLEVYMSTMRRRGAAVWYHFDREFFLRLAKAMTGAFSVFSVSDESGRIISVELVLESDDYLYSFLGGTLEEAFPMSPNDLLKHEAVLYGHRTDRQGFVLGGGYAAGDGIFRYKRAFAANGVRPFKCLRMMGDEQRYRELVDAHAGQRGQVAGPFFPAYRAPLATV
jgi:hypothetical protein